MADSDLRLVHPAPTARKPAVPTPVLGTLIFILTELMMFGGLISALAIARSEAAMWPPPDQPRLPVEETAINTAALLLSGGILWLAGRRFATSPRMARWHVVAAVALGAFFVVFQGFEWAALLSDGLTLTASNFGSFFYLIVGLHALHAVAGLTVVVYQLVLLWQDRLTADGFWAGRLFWYFVVLLWPVLYWRVYW